MSNSNPLLWRKPSLIWRYGIAILAVAAALTISQCRHSTWKLLPCHCFSAPLWSARGLVDSGQDYSRLFSPRSPSIYYYLEPASLFGVRSGRDHRAPLFFASRRCLWGR